MYLGLSTVVKFASDTIVLVTNATPPAQEYERVDISALEDTTEQAKLGRQKQLEFELTQLWKPGDTGHAAIDTKYAAKTEFTVIIEFTSAAVKWTITECSIQRLGMAQIEANKAYMRDVKLFSNGTITQAAIT